MIGRMLLGKTPSVLRIHYSAQIVERHVRLPSSSMHSSPFCLNHHRPPHHLKINSTHKNTATRTSATRRNNCFQYDPLHASMAFVTSGLVITKLMVNNNDNNNDQLRLPSSHQIQNLEVVQNFFTSDSSNIEEWKDFFTSSWKSIRRNVSRELEDDNRKALAGLIAMNTFIFCLWRMAMRHRNSKVEAFMWRHFACSYDTVVYGKRLHTLLTSSFSHLTFPHFGINMFMLWEFGTHVLAPSSNNTNANVWYTKSKLVEAMRNAFSSSTNGSHHKLLSLDKFMTLYMTSALSSSMLSVAVAGLKGTGAVYTLGASGSLMGILTVYCLLFPDQRLLLFGLFDCDARQLLELTTAVNVVGMFLQGNFGVDFTGHLGGQAIGFTMHQSGHLK